MFLPTINLGKFKVTRLICGGNPPAGFSHMGYKKDIEMLNYYTMENIQKMLDECWKNGINTVQFRGDNFFLRVMREHCNNNGKLQWIAQTVSEMKDLKSNIKKIIELKPIAIYIHGTDVDNKWHTGKIDEVKDIINFIKDNHIFAGLGTHIPEVLEYVEEKRWNVDFYMCSFYNLAKKFKPYQADLTKNEKNKVSEKEEYDNKDRDKMTSMMRKIEKPCLGFKILGAGRNCRTKKSVKDAFKYAFKNIKEKDAVVVGMFQKYKNQIKENAQIVKEILSSN